MSIQKKSLLNSLNTTKKAIVASATPAETPSVSGKVSARKLPRAQARVLPRATARISAHKVPRTRV